MTKYLNENGLSYFLQKLKSLFLPLTGGTLTGWLDINPGGITTSKAQIIKDARFDRDGANPTSNIYSLVHSIADKDGENIGYMQAHQLTSGESGVAIIALAEDSGGTEHTNSIVARVGKDGMRSYYVSDPTAFRSAIGFVNTHTDTVSQVITAATGFTISQVSFVQNGQMAQWYMTVKNTNAMAANTQYTIGNIVSGKRPITWTPISFGDTSNTYGNGRLVVGGNVLVRPSANIAANTNFFLLASAYILA